MDPALLDDEALDQEIDAYAAAFGEWSDSAWDAGVGDGIGND